MSLLENSSHYEVRYVLSIFVLVPDFVIVSVSNN